MCIFCLDEQKALEKCDKVGLEYKNINNLSITEEPQKMYEFVDIKLSN